MALSGKLISRNLDNPKLRRIHHGQEKSSQTNSFEEEVEVQSKEEVVFQPRPQGEAG
jgi:hypothetical protein